MAAASTLDPTTYYDPSQVGAAPADPAVVTVNPTLIEGATQGMGTGGTAAGPNVNIDLSGIGHAIADFPSQHPIQFDLNLASVGLGAAMGIPGGPLGVLAGAAIGAGKAIVGDLLSAAASALGLDKAFQSVTDYLGITTPDLPAGPTQAGPPGTQTQMGDWPSGPAGPAGTAPAMDLSATGTSGTAAGDTTAGPAGGGPGGAAGPAGGGLGAVGVDAAGKTA